MSEKRFILCQDDLGNYEIRYDNKVFHFLREVAPILNEQQDTIDKLQELVAELGATLLMNGFEIEINGKDLNELIKDE